MCTIFIFVVVLVDQVLLVLSDRAELRVYTVVVFQQVDLMGFVSILLWLQLLPAGWVASLNLIRGQMQT
jgi:hypothetical protein